jgi:hypothetical protein
VASMTLMSGLPGRLEGGEEVGMMVVFGNPRELDRSLLCKALQSIQGRGAATSDYRAVPEKREPPCYLQETLVGDDYHSLAVPSQCDVHGFANPACCVLTEERITRSASFPARVNNGI